MQPTVWPGGNRGGAMRIWHKNSSNYIDCMSVGTAHPTVLPVKPKFVGWMVRQPNPTYGNPHF